MSITRPSCTTTIGTSTRPLEHPVTGVDIFGPAGRRGSVHEGQTIVGQPSRRAIALNKDHHQKGGFGGDRGPGRRARTACGQGAVTTGGHRVIVAHTGRGTDTKGVAPWTNKAW